MHTVSLAASNAGRALVVAAEQIKSTTSPLSTAAAAQKHMNTHEHRTGQD